MNRTLTSPQSSFLSMCKSTAKFMKDRGYEKIPTLKTTVKKDGDDTRLTHVKSQLVKCATSNDTDPSDKITMTFDSEDAALDLRNRISNESPMK